MNEVYNLVFVIRLLFWELTHVQIKPIISIKGECGGGQTTPRGQCLLALWRGGGEARNNHAETRHG